MVSMFQVQSDYLRTPKAKPGEPVPAPVRMLGLVEMRKGVGGRYNFRDLLTVKAPEGFAPDSVGTEVHAALMDYYSGDGRTSFTVAILSPAEVAELNADEARRAAKPVEKKV